MKTRLLVVDDHPLMRLGVVDVISGYDDIELVGETVVAGAGAAIDAGRPSVVVVGIHPSAGTTMDEAARFIRPDFGLVVLDEDESADRMMDALEHGFAAYIAISGTADQMIAAVRHAHVCPAAFCATGLADAVRVTASREALLSTRERQVLLLLRDGHSGAVIARRLGVSDSSVKTYVNRIYGKLEVSNRSQALVAALGRGLLPSDEVAA